MKYCRNCGNELIDEAVFCPKCGYAVNDAFSSEPVTESTAVAVTEPIVQDAPKENSGSTSGLLVAAKILMIIGTISTCLSLISIPYVGWLICPLPLTWCLPMTLSFCRKVKNGEKMPVKFKVCSLIFVSTVAGILMLCDHESTE